MTRRRGLVAVLIAAVLLALGWTAYQSWQVASALRAASGDAQSVRSALANGQTDVVDARLADLKRNSTDAADRTSGTTWSVLSRLPGLGDDARGIRLVSRTLADLTGSGLEPLADSASDLKSFVPKDGKVPLDALEGLQEPVAQASAAFDQADDDLSAEDPAGFVGPLRDRYRQLAREVADASDALSTADTALQLMPTMLGGEGQRNYLLVFQNNAEIRATGGLPGALSLLTVDDGVMKLTKQAAGDEFGETPTPVLPLTQAEQQIYGDQLGTYFLDANFTPDFPRTADLMKAHWERLFPQRLDGVISLDPVALSYLLEATGKVKVGDVDIDAENAVSTLLNQTYVRFPDRGDQDVFFRQVAQALFDRFTTGSGRPRAILSALQRGADEHRIYVHSFDQAEDAVLAPTEISGALPTEASTKPQVGVYLNDTTGAKMSFYLRYSAQVNATSCLGGVQSLAGELHLESQAPADAATTLPPAVTGDGSYGVPPGSQLVAVRLYAPVGGSIESLMINGEPVAQLDTVDQDGRQVLTAFVQLEPQRTTDLNWTMKSGPDQRGDVDVDVTPSVTSESSSSVARSAC